MAVTEPVAVAVAVAAAEGQGDAIVWATLTRSKGRYVSTATTGHGPRKHSPVWQAVPVLHDEVAGTADAARGTVRGSACLARVVAGKAARGTPHAVGAKSAVETLGCTIIRTVLADGAWHAVTAGGALGKRTERAGCRVHVHRKSTTPHSDTQCHTFGGSHPLWSTL